MNINSEVATVLGVFFVCLIATGLMLGLVYRKGFIDGYKRRVRDERLARD